MQASLINRAAAFVAEDEGRSASAADPNGAPEGEADEQMPENSGGAQAADLGEPSVPPPEDMQVDDEDRLLAGEDSLLPLEDVEAANMLFDEVFTGELADLRVGAEIDIDEEPPLGIVEEEEGEDAGNEEEAFDEDAEGEDL